jgi:hypothetical protein
VRRQSWTTRVRVRDDDRRSTTIDGEDEWRRIYRACTRARTEVRAVATMRGGAIVRAAFGLFGSFADALDDDAFARWTRARAFDAALDDADDAREIRDARWRRPSVRARVDRGDDGG